MIPVTLSYSDMRETFPIVNGFIGFKVSSGDTSAIKSSTVDPSSDSEVRGECGLSYTGNLPTGGDGEPRSSCSTASFLKKCSLKDCDIRGDLDFALVWVSVCWQLSSWWVSTELQSVFVSVWLCVCCSWDSLRHTSCRCLGNDNDLEYPGPRAPCPVTMDWSLWRGLKISWLRLSVAILWKVSWGTSYPSHSVDDCWTWKIQTCIKPEKVQLEILASARIIFYLLISCQSNVVWWQQ